MARPLSMRSRTVWLTGKPAPTVWRYTASDVRSFEGVVDLAIFIAAAGARQLIGADHENRGWAKSRILIGQLFAGGRVQHH